MSDKTVEVELENGRVSPRGKASLPVKAHALLTILETEHVKMAAPSDPGAGLRRFLDMPGLALTPEQSRASMEADYFDNLKLQLTNERAQKASAR